MTPLLTRIEQELAVCTNPLHEAELLAERACYFARTGNFADAKAIAAALRHSYGDGRSVSISIWIMLIEGLVLFFDSDVHNSRDRIYRAHAISKSAGLSRLRALTGVWLAHMEFEGARYNAMAQIVIDTIDVIDLNAHDSQSRLGIVLGDAFLYAGDRRQSQFWYERARWHATEIGDQATVGALMYNRPAFALSLHRASLCAGIVPSDALQLKFIKLELESATSFQLGTGVRALTYLVELCEARVATLEGRFQVASNLFADLRERAKTAHNSADRVSVEIDLAWCLAKTGRFDETNKIVSTIIPADIERLDIDDRLIAVWALEDIGGLSKSIPPIINDVINVAQMSLTYKIDLDELRKALNVVNKEISNWSSFIEKSEYF